VSNKINKIIIFAPSNHKWNSNITGVLFSGRLSAYLKQTIPVFDAFFRICQLADEKQNLPEVKNCNQ
jgi:hypothetical protein